MKTFILVLGANALIGCGLSVLQVAWQVPFAPAFTFYLGGFVWGCVTAIWARAAA